MAWEMLRPGRSSAAAATNLVTVTNTAANSELWKVISVAADYFASVAAVNRRIVVDFIDPATAGGTPLRSIGWDLNLAANQRLRGQTVAGAPDKQIATAAPVDIIAMTPFDPLWLPPGGQVTLLDRMSLSAADSCVLIVNYEIWREVPVGAQRVQVDSLPLVQLSGPIATQ